jgi:hypothetical protein
MPGSSSTAVHSISAAREGSAGVQDVAKQRPDIVARLEQAMIDGRTESAEFPLKRQRQKK